MNRFIVFLLIGLMFISGALAANDVASTQAGSTVAQEIISSTYVDIASNNVSIATSEGELYVQVFTDSRTNYSKKYGSVRIKIDGVEIESMNLSAFTSYTPDSFMAHKTVSEGTHYAEIEVKAYSGKKLYLRSWNMTVKFFKTGDYVTLGELNATVNPNSVNASNLTGTINYSVIPSLPQANVSGLVAGLNSLQSNDTTHDSDIAAIQSNETTYVTNETVQAYSMDAGNLTETINYSVIPSLPQANITNLVSDLAGKEATISEGIANQFYAWNKSWQNITSTWITEGDNLFYTSARAISALSGINSAQNSSISNLQGNDTIHDTSISVLQSNDTTHDSQISSLQTNDTTDRSYVNTTFLPISTYSGDFPNASLSDYLLIATYSGDFPNSTIAGNLENWNATYNQTYHNASIVTTYNPTAMEVVSGTLTDGTIANLTVKDGSTVNITEANGAAPLTINVTFCGVSAFSQAQANMDYEGGDLHHNEMQGLTNTGTWEAWVDITDTDGAQWYAPAVHEPSIYINGSGCVNTRVTHIQNGVNTHTLQMDKFVLQNGGVVGVGVFNHGAATGLDDDDHNAIYPSYARMNASVNPYSFNLSNGTGLLDFINLQNVSLDLANNVTGLLDESNIDSDIARDGEVTALTDTINSSKVNKSGDTMTGALNTTNIFFGNGTNGFGNYSGSRPLVSNAAVSVTVCDSGCDYKYINDATKQIPYYLFHKYEINVAAPYSQYESIYLPPSLVAVDMSASDIAGAGVWLHGDNTDIDAITIKSIHVISNTGALHPYIQYFKVTGEDPNANENVSIAVVGSTDVQLQQLNLSGSTAANGILAYSAGVSVAQIDMGNTFNVAFQTKHNGRFHFEPCLTCSEFQPPNDNISADYNVIGSANYVYANYGGTAYGFTKNGMTGTTALTAPDRAPIFDATNSIAYGINTVNGNLRTTGNFNLTNSKLSNDKLAAHWKFNENKTGIASTTTAFDSSPNAYDATWNGNTTANWTTVNTDGATTLDGIDDYYSTGSVIISDYTQPFSISVKFKTNNGIGSLTHLRSWLGARGDTAGSTQGAYFIYVDTSDSLEFYTGNSTAATNCDLSDGLLDNNEHTITGVYTGSAVLCYSDGELIDTSIASSIPESPNRNFEIGRDSRSADYYANISFIDVRVHERALSSIEARAYHYNPVTDDDESSFIQTNNLRVVNNTGMTNFRVDSTGIVYANGSGLTSINVSNATGTLPTSNLPTNIAFNNTDNNFTVNQTFADSIYVTNDMSALTITDRTPFYNGDALSELAKIKGNNRQINHSTLPKFARVERTHGDETHDERDLGAMISILTVGVNQLNDKFKQLFGEQKVISLQINNGSSGIVKDIYIPNDYEIKRIEAVSRQSGSARVSLLTSTYDTWGNDTQFGQFMITDSNKGIKTSFTGGETNEINSGEYLSIYLNEMSGIERMELNIILERS